MTGIRPDVAAWRPTPDLPAPVQAIAAKIDAARDPRAARTGSRGRGGDVEDLVVVRCLLTTDGMDECRGLRRSDELQDLVGLSAPFYTTADLAWVLNHCIPGRPTPAG